MSNSTVKSNDKEIETLLDHWHEAGARIERQGRANVIKVFPPNGADMITVHTTVSDTRHLQILRGFGRRAGLPAYPGDPHVKTKEQTMSTAHVIDFPQIDLPPNILERTASRPTDGAIGAVRGAVDYLARHGGDGTFWTREATNLVTGFELMPNSTVTNRVPQTLYWLGYRPVEEKKYGRGSQYRWGIVPALDKAAKEVLPMTYLKGEVQMDEPVVDERMITHHENDGHDHAPIEEPIEGGADTGYGPSGPEGENEQPPVEDESAVWQSEAERLEAELVEVKGARIVVDQEVVDLQKQLVEFETWKKHTVDEYEVMRNDLAKAEGKVDQASEEKDALTAQVERLNDGVNYWREQHDNVKHALDVSQRRESDLMREQSMQVIDDGWTTLDIQKLAEQRDGYTIDELITDAAVFGLEVRIQRH